MELAHSLFSPEGGKAPRVGFKELLMVGGHFSIGFFVCPVNHGAREFLDFLGDFAGDLDAMNALDFIYNIDRCHVRL